MTYGNLDTGDLKYFSYEYSMQQLQEWFSDLILVLCLSLSIGIPLLKALGFMETIPNLNYKITALEDVYKRQALLLSTFNINFKKRLFSQSSSDCSCWAV